MTRGSLWVIAIFLGLTSAVDAWDISLTPHERVIPSHDRVEKADTTKERYPGEYFFNAKEKVFSAFDKNADDKPDFWMWYKNNIRNYSEEDKNFDGQVDQWVSYNEKGSAWKRVKDTNNDGKPDQFIVFLRGRNLALKQYDRNFDGKIDAIHYDVWDQEKTITNVIGGRVQRIPNPGYRHIYTQKDENYDGILDKVAVKKQWDKPVKAVGDPIEQAPVLELPAQYAQEEKKENAAAKPKKDKVQGFWNEDKLSSLNERFGLKS